MSLADRSAKTITRDCDEGCDGNHNHKWEIEPHPDNSDFDVCICDDDDEARDTLERVVEKVWDEMEPGDERVIKIRMNLT